MKNLVIVESPAKAKTIESFLGKDYTVLSSYGHIRDLRKKDFSIDVDNGYTPIYEIPAEKKDLVRKLKEAAKKADMVWLASDEDREGEAIAWHLYEVLGLTPERTKRIVFHEITKPALLHAIENPRDIDLSLVDAQQARRVLDRMVGFELSPVLWRKIKPALSAGRVQSVALRLICEREQEIRAFQAEPYYRVNALFNTPDGSQLKAELDRRIATTQDAEDLLRHCSGAHFAVSSVDVKPLTRSPRPPFTTSTLQQEAGRRLGFPVSVTMSTAQKLYEAGLITYMRTDSLNLSNLALRDIANTIKESYGDDYLKVRKYHTSSKGAQEAHEAIRPTYIDREHAGSTDRERALYDLIRRRTLASQMADAQVEKTTVTIPVPGREEVFESSAEAVVFDGFLKVAGSFETEDKDSTVLNGAINEGMPLATEEITATQRFTQAPPRYTEATLVKKMEELGIGRPSTYAPTISTIQGRDYIEKGDKPGVSRDYEVITLRDGNLSSTITTESTGSTKGKLVPTDVGMVVNDFLTEHFPDIMDYNFTARVEKEFDEIAQGNRPWKEEISTFYDNFHPSIERINKLRMEHKVGERELGTDPATGRPVSVKIGRFGPVVQIGEASDSEKPLFASLQKGQNMGDITLEEALKLFELPRTLGERDGEPVVAAIGRFGPYVRLGKVFASLPKDLAPQTVTLEEALELIDNKENAEKNRVIKAYPEMPGLEVINGRYGPYLAYKPEGASKAQNFRLPKDAEPSEITFEQAKAIMEQPQTSSRRTARKSTKK